MSPPAWLVVGFVLVVTGCGGRATAPTSAPRAPTAIDRARASALLGPADRYRVSAQDRPCRGAAEPLVTMVEYVDFHSPFVRRVEPVVARLLREHSADLRVCVRHFPVARDNLYVMIAAEMTEEAFVQGGSRAFFAAYDRLLGAPLSLHSVNDAKNAAGVDDARYRAALTDHRHQSRIGADVALAEEAGHTGAPNFFVNGRNIDGARPYEDFERVIADELERTRAIVAAGVPRAGLFDWVLSHASSRERPRPADDGTVWVALISVSYGGYGMSPATRTREEAEAIASRLLARIRAGEDFAAVAREANEDAMSKRGGELGALRRGTLTRAIEDAAFRLPLDGVELVAGDLGFTIVKRYR